MNSAVGGARSLLDSRLIWCILAAPGVYWLQAYWRGALFYGEVVHASGTFAARLLILTLAITPLTRMLPRAGWLQWLRRRRRYLGVATFGYAALHAAVYFERQEAFAAIVVDARAVSMWTGWVALALMLLLAATSNDASVRRLKRRWQLLHRAVYFAAILSFAHWILSAFNPGPGYIHLAVLAFFEMIRLLDKRARPAGPSRNL